MTHDYKKHPVYNVFEIDSQDRSEFKCTECNFISISGHPENLMRHFQRKHPATYEKLDQKRKSNISKQQNKQNVLDKMIKSKPSKNVSINITSMDIKDACVEMITLNGRPLCLVEDSGFRKIIDPILAALKPPITINVENIRREIFKKAKDLKDAISKELKYRIFSIKMDTATRMDRSILGVNVQYIVGDKIIVKTLAMKEVKMQHSGSNLAKLINDILNEYNLSLKQVYAITTDNGANMIKAGNLLALQQEDLNGLNQDNLDDENIFNQIIVEDDQSLFDFEQNLEKDFNSYDLSIFEFLKRIRCAAHTFQLVVNEILKNDLIKSPVDRAREVVKKLRNPIVMTLLEKEGFNKPILDNSTRWNSTYRMCTRLIDLYPFCIKYSGDFTELWLEEIDWKTIKDLLTILKPINELFMCLQQRDLTLSDFFCCWIMCKKKILSLKNDSPYSSMFLAALAKHSYKVMNCETMYACLYLDPRYHIFLDSDQKLTATNHLLRIYIYYKKHFCPNIVFPVVNDAPEKILKSSEKVLSELEKYIIEIEERKQSEVDSSINKTPETTSSSDRISQEKLKYIRDKLMLFGTNISRMPIDTDILKFWNENPDEELSKLAKIVFSVPATQVTVERAFSTLKFILTDKRDNIDEKLLEDILLIRLNEKFKRE